jgi:hypothetical protein
MAKYHEEVRRVLKIAKSLAPEGKRGPAANPQEVQFGQTTGASGAAPTGSFMRHYLNKIPFPLPLRTKDDLIKAGDILDKEDLTPFTRGYRKDQSQQPDKPKPTPTATAVLNYLIQVFQVKHSNDVFIKRFSTYFAIQAELRVQLSVNQSLMIVLIFSKFLLACFL